MPDSGAFLKGLSELHLKTEARKPQRRALFGTDTGVDQNSQRDLGAIDPYEFQSLGALISGNICMDKWTQKVRHKYPPKLILVHGWLFPEQCKNQFSERLSEQLPEMVESRDL